MTVVDLFIIAVLVTVLVIGAVMTLTCLSGGEKVVGARGCQS